MRKLVTLALPLFYLMALCAPPLFARYKEEVNIITVGPGMKIYAHYGHSCFMILRNDPEDSSKEPMLILYNYGTFNFEKPGFVRNFLKGKLDFFLFRVDYSKELRKYVSHKRDVERQRLNLTQAEIDKIYEFLEWNSKEENKYYKYDFLAANCSSQMVAVLEKCVGPLKYDENIRKDITGRTYRDWIRDYLDTVPWYDLGIQIALGLNTDAKVKPEHAFFLPELTERMFSSAYLPDGRRLVDKVQMIHSAHVQHPGRPGFFTQPFMVFAIVLLFLVLLSLLPGNRKLLDVFDCILVAAPWAVGMMIFYWWFISDHYAGDKNLNILWCNPLLITFIMAKIYGKKRLLLWFSRFMAMMCAASLIVTAAGIQGSCSAFYPVLLMYLWIYVRNGWAGNPVQTPL
ncbi:MAG: DUF4105 domain-containing protein [Spirochaetia bacterium]|nr:DUF4105 domain-containing protein [Spirochaetia bacterium]MBQ7747318.1 DUF4105 domain-containing protein [Spirochaetia bacterium]